MALQDSITTVQNNLNKYQTDLAAQVSDNALFVQAESVKASTDNLVAQDILAVNASLTQLSEDALAAIIPVPAAVVPVTNSVGTTVTTI